MRKTAGAFFAVKWVDRCRGSRLVVFPVAAEMFHGENDEPSTALRVEIFPAGKYYPSVDGSSSTGGGMALSCLACLWSGFFLILVFAIAFR